MFTIQELEEFALNRRKVSKFCYWGEKPKSTFHMQSFSCSQVREQSGLLSAGSHSSCFTWSASGLNHLSAAHSARVYSAPPSARLQAAESPSHLAGGPASITWAHPSPWSYVRGWQEEGQEDCFLPKGPTMSIRPIFPPHASLSSDPAVKEERTPWKL